LRVELINKFPETINVNEIRYEVKWNGEQNGIKQELENKIYKIRKAVRFDFT